MISERNKYGGTFDFMAWLKWHTKDGLADIKSGTYPKMTIIQICAYEDLARYGKPVDPSHTGLPWMLELVGKRASLDRFGLQLDKSGRFTTHFETTKGEPYSLGKWTAAWRSGLHLHRVLPHEYVFENDYGHPQRGSRLSDMNWVLEAIKGNLKDKDYDLAMRCGENVFNVRQQYGLI